MIKENLPELLTRNETEKLLDEIRHEHTKLIDELIPTLITVSVLQKVLQNLLSERISVRDLSTILEAMADGVQSTKNITHLTEIVRQRLARQICTQNTDHEGVIPIVALSGVWEKEFSQAVRHDGDDRQLAMEPTKVQGFIQAVRDGFDKQMMNGVQPVLLCSPSNRPFVRSVLERAIPAIAILSQAEIYPKAKIRTVGTV